MPTDVKEVFTGSALSKDPKRFNIFMFMLDAKGRVIHEFHGLPGKREGKGDGRSDYKEEITKALAKLKLPTEKPILKADGQPNALPDLKGTRAGVPGGVRLFIRLHDEKDPVRSKMPVVEVVPMKSGEWQGLSLPDKAIDIEVKALANWLVHLYPAGIRTADQAKPFTNVTGSLKLEPAGADKQGRYALLRGKVRLAKGGDSESTFEGTLQAVLTYSLNAPEVQSLRGVVEGDYVYRLRGTQRMPLRAAIESRPK
jgi:hypothetical protein